MKDASWPSWNPYGPRNPRRTNPRALQLTEISILRRMVKRQKMTEIAEALGMNPGSITHAKRKMREAFGVDTDEELLTHPDVLRQIKE